MKLTIKIVLFLPWIFFSNTLYSYQQSILEGRVIEKEGLPIENVYIYNKTQNTHTHSLLNGTFKLKKTNVGDTIQIGLLGYEKRIITLTQKHFDNPQDYFLRTKLVMLDELVLTKELNAIQSITKVDVETSPVNSSQEILRKVPGLFIGQHAGGGKAEQIFLRGFDIDHGTDLTLSVDGMPINMVSHAHGQGYSDLHFIIPETIQKINFGKGPYYAEKGDFNTAGYVEFETKKKLDNSKISLSIGDFNSFRTLAMVNLLKDNNAYLAFEYLESDGPYVSPQNFNRSNIFGKYSISTTKKDQLSLTFSYFKSRWNASGQIPERAVKNGSISRFGSIDDTEGGNTSRANINLQYVTSLKNTIVKSNFFYTDYNFELFSNFTFFFKDPENGDQIKQYENREILGFNTQFINSTSLGNFDVELTNGIGVRKDIVNNIELSHTKNKVERLESIQLGNIDQSNFYLFFNSDFKSEKFTISPSIRLDYFNFLYEDKRAPNSGTALSNSKTIVTPHLNFLFNQNNNVQWFLKSGIGFHSNDARLVLQQNTTNILPKAYGLDIGNIWKPVSNLILNTAVWYLFSEEELVYVGDEGVIEPNGKSERFGVDLGFRYHFSDWLYLDTDATITKAINTELDPGFNYIPLAPKLTVTGGLAIKKKKISGSLRYRFLDDRPANEDNSIVARGYFVTDLNMNYKIQKNITLGFSIENLFNTNWKETQFATESRLRNESSSVEEIHFTPGTPFLAKAKVTYSF
ncbi:TonB-dependent receptor [Tenacibaculum sp. IB213877]|uniref:TonB-dependent receptor n=1 Tax=Tenacibaculum sp. IB213877 TaxID=3097351 RepID=UPI002A5AE6A4|nr:TonB-dependent receptor [Tenacibaculum sp. IB213877]MDY0779780.1 TonB-dependent receptor [Tenacibaculum sp. IB213877]